MSKEDLLQSRINNIKKQQTGANKPEKADIVKNIVSQEEEKVDFEKIAEELAERHEKEAVSLNSGYVKETVYIRQDISKAINSLCLKHGDKKKVINEALADYVQKKYRELKR